MRNLVLELDLCAEQGQKDIGIGQFQNILEFVEDDAKAAQLKRDDTPKLKHSKTLHSNPLNLTPPDSCPYGAMGASRPTGLSF